MISKEDIKKLADLARIEIEEEEVESLRGEMDAILGYVGQINEVTGSVSPLLHLGEGQGVRFNVFRKDENPTESGTYSQELISEFPERENNYLKVKKIL